MFFHSLTNYCGRCARRRAAASTIAMAIAGLAATPALGGMETVTCESLSIGVEDASFVQVCLAGDFVIGGGEGAPTDVSMELIRATGEGGSSLTVISHRITGRRAWSRLNASTFVKSLDLHDPRNWGDTHEVDDFDVVTFEAQEDNSRDSVRCVGFLRYIGPVPRSFGGFRQQLGGAYCKNQDADIPADEVESVLQSLKF